MSAFLSYGLTPALALVVGVSASVYLFYLWLLPKPIPGIPYNPEAAKSIFGDLGPITNHINQTQEMFAWIGKQSIKLQSPIIQVWGRPFGKPWVVITDFRESQDILLRRTKEFDRAKFMGDLFLGLLPEHHISMKTNETFKQHRRWLQDLMTPDFLNNIAAPRIYTSFEDVIRLWGEKERLANGHPIPVADDVYRGALDAVWATVFGDDPLNSTTNAQIKICSSLKEVKLPGNIDEAAMVPMAPNPPPTQSVLTLSHSLETSVKSPIPIFAHWVLRQLPYMRRAIKIKDDFIRQEVEKTRQRFSADKSSKDVRCAMDDIIRREMLLSEKEGREPMLHSRAMYDEIFGFVIGAHETTATTITWAVKILADNQEVQSKVRSVLRSSYTNAVSENRSPNIQEITKTVIPYLDAVIEELFRTSGTAPLIARTAEVDVEVLGKHIPKGTDVIFMTGGPSLKYPAFNIPESLRSPSALGAKHVVPPWDPKDIGSFKPERWLVEGANGEKVFDASAGPMLGFGLGPRGCFGRRLAYLEFKLVIVLILWNFELLECPESMSTYAAVDRVTRQPQKCYAKLKNLTLLG